MTMPSKRARVYGGLLATLGVLAVVTWLVLLPPLTATAAVSYTPLDDVDSAQIDQLRTELGVTDDALAALDANSEQLTTILAAVRGWYEDNRADLLAARSDLANRQARVKYLESRNRVGDDVADALAAARSAAASEQAAYDSRIVAVRQLIWQQLSAEQQVLVDRMRGQTDVPMPYRPLALTDQQQTQLGAASSVYRTRVSFARDAALRNFARQAFAQQRASILGANGLQQVADIQDYLPASAVRVVDAIQTVLPIEEPDPEAEV